MIKPLLTYPDPKIRLISANVRFFNEELHQWIEDMIDTMKAHDLTILSAILIGIQYNILVVREEDTFIPYINGRLIKHSGRTTATERSPYYPGISVDVERYERVTLIYEDSQGEVHSEDLEGQKARDIQHYMDYSYGSTFVDRVDKEMKQQINDHLEFGLVPDARGGECPTVFFRDYFLKSAKWILRIFAVSTLIAWGVGSPYLDWISSVKWYVFGSVIALMVGYFLYAQYEAKVFKQCTSCQTGNILGTTFILLFWWLVTLLFVITLTNN